MKIDVPPQTPKIGLDQGESQADEMVVNLSSIPDLKVNFNTALSYWGQLKAWCWSFT